MNDTTLTIYVLTEVSCSFPGNPDNGITTPLLPEYAQGDAVTFRCLEGYKLMGAESIKCTAEGKFTNPIPSCERELF